MTETNELREVNKIFAKLSNLIPGKYTLPIKQTDYKRASNHSRRLGQTLFTGGLPVGTTFEDLNVYFSKYGKVANIFFFPNKFEPSTMNNYAEIEFAHSKAHSNALVKKVHSIRGKIIDCDHWDVRKRTVNYNNIYLGGDSIIH